MRTRVGWGVVAAVMAAAAGVGCGQENGGTPSLKVPVVDTDGGQPPVTQVPDTDGEPPPITQAPDAGWWQVSPEAGPITFEVPACIQVNVAASPRFGHPCTVKHFRKDGTLTRLQRFDAENRLVEDAFFEGEGSWPMTHFWSYDGAGRLVRERFVYSSESENASLYLYDAQGRLEHVEGFWIDRSGSGVPRVVPNLRYRYLYDGAGRLEATEYSSDGIGWYAYETFLYHPNGQLRRRSEVYDRSAVTSQDYDEKGRLIGSELVDESLGESRRSTAYTYDARGLRVEEHRRHDDHAAGWSEGFTRYLYDESGRLGAERITEDGAYTRLLEPYYIRQRVVKRYFHGCGGELLFEEQDTNEDGLRDGWRELVRDAAGNLRVERLHGTHVAAWPQVSRIEYEYGCHE